LTYNSNSILNQVEQQLPTMQSALDAFNAYQNTLKMSTGSAELDSLIDSIQEGIFYLFYGTHRIIFDSMVYRFLVQCILPVKREHGFESMGVCFHSSSYNNSNRNTRTTFLNPEKIGIIAKCAGIDPKIVFKNLLIQTAYNEQQQISAAEQVVNLIESNENIKLLVINQLTKFVKDSKSKNKKREAANVLKKVLGIVCRVCAKNKVAIIATGDANPTSKGIIPRPIGGMYLKHAANVIVNIKENSKAYNIPSFKATLMKHQYQRTPNVVLLGVKKIGGILFLD
jgi:Rad51